MNEGSQRLTHFADRRHPLRIGQGQRSLRHQHHPGQSKVFQFFSSAKTLLQQVKLYLISFLYSLTARANYKGADGNAASNEQGTTSGNGFKLRTFSGARERAPVTVMVRRAARSFSFALVLTRSYDRWPSRPTSTMEGKMKNGIGSKKRS